MGLKQELEGARTAVGAALHNANTALTESGAEPVATVAALAQAITKVYSGAALDNIIAIQERLIATGNINIAEEASF